MSDTLNLNLLFAEIDARLERELAEQPKIPEEVVRAEDLAREERGRELQRLARNYFAETADLSAREAPYDLARVAVTEALTIARTTFETGQQPEESTFDNLSVMIGALVKHRNGGTPDLIRAASNDVYRDFFDPEVDPNAKIAIASFGAGVVKNMITQATESRKNHPSNGHRISVE